MLDAVQPTTDLLSAVQAWRPDPACLSAGDEYVRLAVRAYAASGLSDPQIDERVRDLAGVASSDDTIERCDAAIATARHAALMGVAARQIVALLMHLEAEVPCWPDADEVASIVQGAITEFTS